MARAMTTTTTSKVSHLFASNARASRRDGRRATTVRAAGKVRHRLSLALLSTWTRGVARALRSVSRVGARARPRRRALLFVDDARGAPVTSRDDDDNDELFVRLTD